LSTKVNLPSPYARQRFQAPHMKAQA